MPILLHRWMLPITGVVCASLCSCNGEDEAAKPTPPAGPPTRSVTADPSDAKSADTQPMGTKTATTQRGQTPGPSSKGAGATAPDAGNELVLTGITLRVPDGWVRQPVELHPLAAKVVFRLPGAGDDSDDATVRITYFPDMRRLPAMVEMNVNRWLRQVSRPDGSPYTRDNTQPSVFELGPIRVTVVDLIGTVREGMGGGTASVQRANHRMIAAIVEHSKGPHFIKAVGGVSTMQHWEATIEKFLKSVKTN